jgi:hypothetical protein
VAPLAVRFTEPPIHIAGEVGITETLGRALTVRFAKDEVFTNPQELVTTHWY